MQAVNSLFSMGFHPDKTQAFLDHIGICEENLMWVTANIDIPDYKN